MTEQPVGPAVVVLDDVGTGHWRTVSTGRNHTCAIDLDGRAWCWGSNASYQLGVEQVESTCGTDPVVPCSLRPVPVATGRTFSAISAGREHTCAITTDSVPFCWGGNSSGQLGFAGLSTPDLHTPGTSPMRSISAGGSHSCGVRTDNLIVCWGSNRFGAVGAGNGVGVPPSFVGGNLRFLDVVTSDQRTCARTTSRRVLCWGAVWSHTSGDTNYSLVVQAPTPVSKLGAMAAMDVGPTSLCSIDATGFAWCMEANLSGESGTGPGPGTSTPRRVAIDAEFRSLSLGDGYACGVDSGGVGYCWGTNGNFQIGAPTTEFCGQGRTPCTTRPVRIVGNQRFTTVSAGLGSHVCGVTDHFNLYCWGTGSYGQRGDGTTAPLSRIPRLAAVVHYE